MTAAVDLNTGYFQHDASRVDNVRYVLRTVPRNPDVRTEKWDEVGQAIVAKSAAEITAYDADALNTEALGAFDTQRALNAIVWAILDTYSAPATPAKFAAARTKILEDYKTQPWK